MTRRRSRTQHVIDPRSGEEFVLPVPVREYQGHAPPHVQVFQESLQALIEADLLTRTEYRVWMWMCAKCQYGNHVPVSQQQIGERLQIGKGEVSRVLTKLVGVGLLYKMPRLRTRIQHYRLSTIYIHRGKLSEMMRQFQRDPTRNGPTMCDEDDRSLPRHATSTSFSTR